MAAMDGKTIKNVELRANAIVMFFTDGTRFDFTFENVEGKNDRMVSAAVARFNHRVLWTSNDHKMRG